jgi:hypothetical protein
MPLDRIEIPDSARRPKPVFPTLPDRSIVDEVRNWIKDGNPTYTWRGHTHTMPELGAAVEYAGDFQLAKGEEAPCPCCTPETAKFNVGLIAWFPETQLVRLMGPHCFRRINPEGHEAAYQNLQERIKRQGAIKYLLNNLPKRSEAQSALQRALPIATHLDDLQDILGAKLERTIGVDLWRHVREGSLRVINGPPGREFYTHYATIAGTGLIDPRRKKIRPRVENATKNFASIEIPDNVEAASDPERNKAARQFSRAMKLAQAAFADIDDCRLFLTPLNIATIRQWGSRLDAPEQIYMRRDGLKLMIGKTEDDPRTVILDGSLDMPTPRLPEIVIE